MTIKLEMLVGLAGPEYTLSPGDKRDFGDEEAGRLVDAGFAKLAEDDEEAETKPARGRKKGQ